MEQLGRPQSQGLSWKGGGSLPLLQEEEPGQKAEEGQELLQGLRMDLGGAGRSPEEPICVDTQLRSAGTQES